MRKLSKGFIEPPFFMIHYLLIFMADRNEVMKIVNK